MRRLRLVVTPEAFAMLQQYYHTGEDVQLDITMPFQLSGTAKVTAIDPVHLSVELTLTASAVEISLEDVDLTELLRDVSPADLYRDDDEAMQSPIIPPEPHPNCRCELPPTLFGYPVVPMPESRPPRVLVDLLDMPEPERSILIAALKGGTHGDV